MHIPTLSTAALLLAAAASSAADVLEARQSNNTEAEYLQEVCFPPGTNPVAPCQSIIDIQTACQPNGTSTLALIAHAQCMCGGSFFSDWIGCLNCNYVHGARSPQLVSAFNTIITSASHALCTGTPTASFAAIFSGLSDNSGVGEGGGDTSVSDQFPSQTAVSLYFTATGRQGPGAITGSATAATATGVTVETPATSASSAAGSSSSSRVTAATTGSTASSARSTGTSTSTGGAAPTGLVRGGWGAIAGGILLAAL